MMFGRKLVRAARYAELKEREHAHHDLTFLKALDPSAQQRCLALLEHSKSQIRQDLFALAMLDFPQNGFFVEFGATDGVSLNNTWLMETQFGWSGILAEPGQNWHDALRANRACHVDTRAVWKESSKTLRFTEAPRQENSGLTELVKPSRRMRGVSYDVTSVTLNDLLDAYAAPSVIDYLSVDTEGSEADILSAVDWNKWRFKVITVEHNFQPQRARISQILTQVGYRQMLPEVSNFDDWYVLESLAD